VSRRSEGAGDGGVYKGNGAAGSSAEMNGKMAEDISVVVVCPHKSQGRTLKQRKLIEPRLGRNA